MAYKKRHSLKKIKVPCDRWPYVVHVCTRCGSTSLYEDEAHKINLPCKGGPATPHPVPWSLLKGQLAVQ